MQARILVVDGIATHRIVLRAKLLADHYQVTTVPSLCAAQAALGQDGTDLILLNMLDRSIDPVDLCRWVRARQGGGNIGIIGIHGQDRPQARLAVLDAGADDILPDPVSDTFLMARIRSLLRVRLDHSTQLLRDSAVRALGFEDRRDVFDLPVAALLIEAAGPTPPGRWTELADRRQFMLRRVTVPDALATRPAPGVVQTVIFDASMPGADPDAAPRFVRDMRAHLTGRDTGILVLLPSDLDAVGANCLDLGADQVAMGDISPKEVAHRLDRLARIGHRKMALTRDIQAGLKVAGTDPLTGLSNRRTISVQAQKMLNASSAQRPLAVLMIDMDHFKSVNDRFGHPVGDRVLVQVAQRLRRFGRKTDLIARMGGEEFMLLAPATSHQRAIETAERLRRAISEQPFAAGPGGASLHLSVSVGVTMAAPDATIEHAYAQADAALLAAKRAGRNQVAIDYSAA